MDIGLLARPGTVGRVVATQCSPELGTSIIADLGAFTLYLVYSVVHYLAQPHGISKI